jgi:membrane-associated phospholipid phosphatase
MRPFGSAYVDMRMLKSVEACECEGGALSFRDHVKAAFSSKLRFTPLVLFLAIVPYQIAQRLAPSHHYRIDESRWDQLVGFEPAWVWIYVSLYLLVWIPPWLALSKEAVHRYVRGVLWMVPISCVAWLGWPVAGPRPEVLPKAGTLFAWLVSVDSPINTIPSMHMALAVYSLLFARRTLEQCGRGWIFLGVGFVWVALIAYSCLATKQHFVVDLLAGMMVAVISDAAAWRTWRGRKSDLPPAGRHVGFPGPDGRVGEVGR